MPYGPTRYYLAIFSQLPPQRLNHLPESDAGGRNKLPKTGR